MLRTVDEEFLLRVAGFVLTVVFLLLLPVEFDLTVLLRLVLLLTVELPLFLLLFPTELLPEPLRVFRTFVDVPKDPDRDVPVLPVYRLPDLLVVVDLEIPDDLVFLLPELLATVFEAFVLVRVKPLLPELLPLFLEYRPVLRAPVP